MAIKVGSTQKFAAINEPTDPTSSILTGVWHAPIIRIANNAKLIQPDVNGIGLRWNLTADDFKVNHRTGTWSGNVITRFNNKLNTDEVSPAGASSLYKRTYSTSTYSWASNITIVKGTSGSTPDYIKLPSNIRNYIGTSNIWIEMYVVCSGRTGNYNAMQLYKFGVAILSAASSFDKTSNLWTKYQISDYNFSCKQFGYQGSKYTASISKAAAGCGISSAANPIFIVPYVSENNAVCQINGTEYVTDILIGIKLTT